jgi:DsbC/DsbD-like thiol-disulfide interchange protein
VRRVYIRLLTPLALILVAPAAAAQDPVQWSGSAVRAGDGSVTATLRATVQKGWYIYSLEQPANGPTPLRFRAGSNSGASVGAVTEPSPRVSYDQGFRMRVGKHYGTPAFTMPLKLTNSAATVPVDVRYQACNDNICLPPRTKTVQINLPRAR